MSQDLKKIWYDLRLIFVQKLLLWAFRVAPDGPEKDALAQSNEYFFRRSVQIMESQQSAANPR